MVMSEERIESQFPVLNPGDFRFPDGMIDKDAWVRYVRFMETPATRAVRLTQARKVPPVHRGELVGIRNFWPLTEE